MKTSLGIGDMQRLYLLLFVQLFFAQFFVHLSAFVAPSLVSHKYAAALFHIADTQFPAFQSV